MDNAYKLNSLNSLSISWNLNKWTQHVIYPMVIVKWRIWRAEKKERRTYRNVGRIEKVRGGIGRMVTINGGRRRRFNGMLRRVDGCNSRRSHRREIVDLRIELNWGFMSNGKGGWNLKSGVLVLRLQTKERKVD